MTLDLNRQATIRKYVMSNIKAARYVKRSFPHDESSFCQGLLVHDALLYESAGWYGQSRLQVSPWPPLASAPVRKYPLLESEFGEDVALLSPGGRLLQGTWLEGYAILWSVKPVRRVRTMQFEQQEMWGLTYDHDRQCLYSSHGDDSTIMIRNAALEVVGRLDVRYRGRPVGQLNALSYCDQLLWANLYPTADLVIIDVNDGSVRGVLDCAALTPGGLTSEEEVFNGLSHLPGGKEIVASGKHWPEMFVIDIGGVLGSLL
jgi:glutaminyl-peptide cyclotransferase